MRRLVILLAAVFAFGSLGLAGCAKKEGEKKEGAKKEETKKPEKEAKK